MQQIANTTDPQINTTAERERRARIRTLNDAFRQDMGPGCMMVGRKMMTSGVLTLGSQAAQAIARQVAEFKEFNEDNDPWGEHDFGAFDYGGEKIFWKIDYYDRAMENGSPDPADPKVTCRVLTILLADEY